ncbi:MAG: restriction endonuclease [Lachnospiraceae bacterium]|nr:restriction endonuclease [Lachnospiraceae bacterium]
MNVVTIAIVIIGVAVLIFLAVWIWFMKRNRDDDEQIFDDMEGAEFENYCAELLEAAGFDNVETTPASHDYGVDIIADRDGITYAIQCKCLSDSVGIKAVQEAYAGKDYYGVMVAAVMTNQNFTKSAVEFANKLNVVLWDGDYVINLIHKTTIPEKKKLMQFVRPEIDNAKKDPVIDKHMGQ